MRILQVGPGFPPDRIGGVEHYVSLLSKQLKSRGHEVTVLVPRWNQPLLEEGVRQLVIPLKLNEVLGYLYWSAIARFILIAGRFDIVHCHHLEGNLLASQPLLRVPTIVHVHTLIVPDPKFLMSIEHRLGWGVYSRALGRARHVITPTLAAKEKLLHDSPFLFAKKVSVIPNMVDTDFFNPAQIPRERMGNLSRQDLVILYLGKIRREKGIEDICKAYRLTRNRNLKLVVAGAPTATTRFLDYLRAAYPETVFTGRVVDSRWWYRAADMFCIYTTGFAGGETFAIALAEAMSMGLPIVCSDNPIYREVTSGNALYVKPGDIKALADAFELLASDTALRVEMGAKARERAVLTFTKDRVVSLIEALYRDATASWHGPALS